MDVNTKSIRLTKGAEMLVDEEDYTFLSRFKLCLTSNGYAKTGENLYVHRLIMGVGTKLRVVDHINGDKLDNRKHNLRVTNQAMNALNTNKTHGQSTYRGVYRYGKSDTWVAQFRHKHLGLFDVEEDAARAYIKAKNDYISLHA